MTPLYDGLPNVSPTVGTFAPLHWLIPKPWETCSSTKCPKTENLLVKLWSMRTISSRKFVGELLPPINVGFPLASTALAFGKMPAFSRAVALPSSSVVGILLPVKGTRLELGTARVGFPLQFPLASGVLRV